MGDGHTDIQDSNGTSHQLNGHHDEIEPEELLDVVVVGAGFAGCYLLYKLRQRGFKVKIVDAASDLGGSGIGTHTLARVSTANTQSMPYHCPKCMRTGIGAHTTRTMSS